MISSTRALAAMAAALALLGGCDRQLDERAQASGEVLEGTISDAMIETDRVRSGAPIAPRRAESEGGAGKATGPASDNDTDEPEADDAPVVAEEQPATAPKAEPDAPDE